MDDKRRSKRSKPMDEGMWDCSVCTYKNASEAFKCEMCDVRKGTSTRKPRINPQLVAQQVVAQHTPLPPPVKKEKKERDKDDPNTPGTKTSPSAGQKRKSNRPPRLKNIDRSSGTSLAVTVDDVTVIITDYKPKKPRTPVPSESNSSITSSDAPESSQNSGESTFPPIKDSPVSDTNASSVNSVPQSSQNGDLDSET